MSATLKAGTLRRYIDLPESDVKWAEIAYGKRNFSRIMGLLLAAFRKTHQHTPVELAEIGAAELKKSITSGSVDANYEEEGEAEV
jgi:hypothetical protein